MAYADFTTFYSQTERVEEKETIHRFHCVKFLEISNEPTAYKINNVLKQSAIIRRFNGTIFASSANKKQVQDTKLKRFFHPILSVFRRNVDFWMFLDLPLQEN
jgi:hypothetical protein